MNNNKKLISILLLLGLIHLTIHQAPTQVPKQSLKQVPKQANPNPQNYILKPQTIRFNDNNLESSHIQFKQIQYSYNPEINEDYSIVKNVIYPPVQPGSSRFVPKQPKNNFVTKLTQKNSIVQIKDQEKTTQKGTQDHKITESQKQVQKKASEIFKKQTIQQEAKLQEQKKTQQQPTPPKEQIGSTPPKEQVGSTPPKEQIKPTPLKQQNQPTPPKEQSQPTALKQDLFGSMQTKNHPQIQKIDKQIKFKEHQVAKPLSITTYPFEKKKESKKTQKTKISSPVQEKKTEPQPKQAQNLQKQTKLQNNKETTKLQINKETTQPKQILSKPKQPNVQQIKEIPTITEKKEIPTISEKKEIIVEDKAKSTNQPKLVKPVNQKVSEKPELAKSKLDEEMVAEFKRITKSLSMEPQKIKSSLQFEALVKEQIQESDWKLLLAKIVIWATILIAIYQATCSSQSQENKIEKGKYSPLGLSELETENSLEMTERAQHR